MEEIRKQLELRESNRADVEDFLVQMSSGAIQSFGKDDKLMIDTRGKRFLVARTGNFQEENPDVIEAKYFASCTEDISSSRTELKHENDKGEEVSYFPPRYEYSYEFYVEIQLQGHPYVDEIRFRLNPHTVEIYSEAPTQNTLGGFGQITEDVDGIYPELNPEYRQYHQMAEEICMALRQLNALENQESKVVEDTYGATAPGSMSDMAAPTDGPWICLACGGQNTGKFCEYCGTPRPR